MAQNPSAPPIRSANENKVLRQAGVAQIKPGATSVKQPMKAKLAPLNPEPDRSQLPPISGNQENVPPQTIEAKPRMTFREKVGMLGALKGGGMMQYDYRQKRHTVEPMAPVSPLPPVEPPCGEPERPHMMPVKPVIRTVKRPGVRRPTALTPQGKPL